MIIKAEKREEHSFFVLPPIFTPYYNLWGKNVYWQNTSFDHDPFTIRADSTSGSPVIIAGNKFFGFLNESGGRFAYDGRNTLTVTLEAGQELLVDECCDPWSRMQEHAALVIGEKEREEQVLWSSLEYCTWVEQTRASGALRSQNYLVFDEKFVYDFMRRIDKLGLPKHGKLTIDDGWAVLRNERGQYLIGDWDIDREKFPNFEKMIKDMESEGFAAGLWFAPFNLSPDSRFGRAHPELLGDDKFADNRHYIRCTPETEPVLHGYFRDMFKPYIEMGIKKLKLDIAYSRKDEMIGILRIINEEVKRIDPTVEIESHIPDAFAARYVDTVRMNDASITPNNNIWQSVIYGHFQVCHYSSSRILNLDHIGGNTPQYSSELFMQHTDMLLDYSRLHKSYPVVSLLPDFYSQRTADEFAAKLREFGC